MIRFAKKKDVKKIQELGKLLNKNFDRVFKYKNIIKEPFTKVYVAEDNNQIIGFLHITELYECVDIVNIIVAQDHRNKGIGKLLLDYMFSDISSDVEVITLEVSIENIVAINLYKRFGFEIINTRSKYYDNGTDAYLMGRKLSD